VSGTALGQRRVRIVVLLVLICAAVVAGVVAWLIRSSVLGEPRPIGSPLTSGSEIGEGWVALADAPIARLEMATTALDDRIWLAGGFTPDGSATAELWAFDPRAQRWSEAPVLPEPVHHAALASDGTRLLIAGGYAGAEGQATAATWFLDPASGHWESGPKLPEARGAGAMAFDGERFIYAGGVGPTGVSDAMYALAAGDELWAEAGSLSRPREHIAAAADGRGTVWFLGGRQGGLDTNVGDVDLLRGTSLTALQPLSPRGGVAAFFAPSVGACLTGGEAPGRAFTTVECIDANGRLTALPGMGQPRHGHGIGVVDGVAYALLGGLVPGLDARSSVESLLVDR
jgi:Galactose oxidase, central domain